MVVGPFEPGNIGAPTLFGCIIDVTVCIDWLPTTGVTGDGAVLVVGVFVPPVAAVAPVVAGPDGSRIMGFNLIRAQIGLPCKEHNDL